MKTNQTAEAEMAKNKNDHQVSKGYKRTKVGVIPNEWDVCVLADISKIERGRFSPRPRNDPKFYGGDIPFVQTSDVSQSDGFVYSHSQTLNEEGLKVSKLFKKGTILITIASNIGHSAIIGYDMACPDSLIGLKVKEGYNTAFLNFYLRKNQRRVEYDAPGAQKNINVEFLRPYPIIKPPLPEQQKIAEILGTWDEAIQKCEQTIATLKTRNKGLAQQLLSGKKRLEGFEEEWEEYCFEDIAHRITRRNEELDDTVVTISAKRGFVRQEDFFKKRVASTTLSHYYLIHKGEFAFNKSYSKGYPMGAFKRLDSSEKAVVTTLYICFALKKEVSSDFMVHFFESGRMVRNLMRIAQEGGRAHGLLNIGMSDFFGLKLSLPAFKEQQAIAAVLSEADYELQFYQQKLSTLKHQKKGLMQKLLTGEVRVKIDQK